MVCARISSYTYCGVESVEAVKGKPRRTFELVAVIIRNACSINTNLVSYSVYKR